jgi:predicted Zn-dependent peptidase
VAKGFKIKTRKCKVCERDFTPMNSLQQVCNYICALKFNDKKEIEKRIKQMKSDVQSVQDVEKIARTVFQQWIRKRDEKLPCISCGKTETKQWDAGHFYSAEQFSGLIFNEMNCNKQCCYCNRNLYGNQLEYRKGMIAKYGSLAVEGLEELSINARVHKFTKDELKAIAQKYKQKLK